MGSSRSCRLRQPDRRAVRQVSVLILVVSGHVLLVILFSRSGSPDARKHFTRTEPPPALVLLNLESPAEQPLPEQTSVPAAPPAHSSRPHSDRARKSSHTEPGEPSGEASQNTAIDPGAAGVAPRLYWQRELETAVDAATPDMINEYMRVCAEAERTHAPRPPGCIRRSFDGPWRPSGNLLQDMRDPDRPRSSVPEPLPDAFSKAPRPEAFRNDH